MIIVKKLFKFVVWLGVSAPSPIRVIQRLHCNVETGFLTSHGGRSTMVFRKISDNLKEAAVRLKERGQDTDQEISEITGMSIQSVYRARERKRLTGSVAPAPAIGRGRPRSLTREDSDFLLQLARYKPSMFLDEYMSKLNEYRHLSASISTIHRTFERAGLSVKRIQKVAAERDPEKRSAFVWRIGEYPPHYLISIDEVSKDDRTYARLWGRAPIGEYAEQHNPFVRKRRYSMCAAMALDKGIIAARVLEGSFTHETFLEFLRDDIVSSFFNLGSICSTSR
jgi:transposase